MLREKKKDTEIIFDIYTVAITRYVIMPINKRKNNRSIEFKIKPLVIYASKRWIAEALNSKGGRIHAQVGDTQAYSTRKIRENNRNIELEKGE